MSDAKIHHYVPQAYLRSFADASEKLWAFNKETKKGFNPSIRNVAAESHFHSSDHFEDTKGDRLFLEKKLGSEEGRYATVLRELLSGIRGRGNWRLKKPHRFFLAKYVALQFMRTRENRNKYREMIEGLGEWFAGQCQQHGYEVPAEYAESFDDPEFRAGEIQKSLLVDDVVVQQNASILFHHIWQFYEAPKGGRFYTSDHPVVLHGHLERPHRGVGIQTEGVEILFPLTPTILLSLSDRKFFKELEVFDGTFRRNILCSENVLWANNQQILKSNRLIFSDVNEFSLVEEVLAECPQLGDPSRRRLKSN